MQANIELETEVISMTSFITKFFTHQICCWKFLAGKLFLLEKKHIIPRVAEDLDAFLRNKTIGKAALLEVAQVFFSHLKSSWWLQPNSKILVKLDHFPGPFPFGKNLFKEGLFFRLTVKQLKLITFH